MLQVIRKVQSSEDDLCVKVFKSLSDFDGGLKWVEIKTIGNHALFFPTTYEGAPADAVNRYRKGMQNRKIEACNYLNPPLDNEKKI
ncbi:hypothetical protein ACLB2K_028421 [Fragaria x ananassa]